MPVDAAAVAYGPWDVSLSRQSGARGGAQRPGSARGRALVAAPGAVRSQPQGRLPPAGEGHLLEVATDPLVEDCLQILHRAAAEHCGRQYEVDILSARLRVVEGFSVQALVRVSNCPGGGGRTPPELEQGLLTAPGHCYHEAEFAFKAAPRRGEATPAGPTVRGLSARLLMYVDLCSIDANSSLQLDTPDLAAAFAQPPQAAAADGQHGRGRKRRLRMLGAVQDPHRGLRGASSVPANFSFLEAFPECFGGSAAVHSQGVCASAWAFAAASALSASLCASRPRADPGALRWRGAQVSVQQLLSCNPSRRGCDGGTAAEAAEALQAAGGIAADGEGSLRYACGGGTGGASAGAAEAPIFTHRGGACQAWPWGGRCESAGVRPGWMYGGLRWAAGEGPMMRALVAGRALYCSFEVHESFLLYAGGIYVNASGRKLGGHASVCLGYGSESGEKYWILQNSWGAAWGSGGFVKFKRGVNLCGVEEGAVYFLAHIAGAEHGVNSTADEEQLPQRGEHSTVTREVPSPKSGATVSACAGLDCITDSPAFLPAELAAVATIAVAAWRYMRSGLKAHGAQAHRYERLPQEPERGSRELGALDGEAGAAELAGVAGPHLRRANATVEAVLAELAPHRHVP